MTIRIHPNGQISVKYPYSYNRKTAELFVENKKNWISKKLKHNEHFQNLHNQSRDELNRGIIYLWGEKRSWKLDRKLVEQYQIEDEIIRLKYPPTENIKSIKKLLSDSLIHYSFEKIRQLSKIHQLTYRKCSMMSSVRNWGTCNSKAEIRLNYKLAFLPKVLVDHIISHELTHLKYFNHSFEFYNFLQMLDPNSEKNRNELKKYAFILNIL